MDRTIVLKTCTGYFKEPCEAGRGLVQRNDHIHIVEQDPF